MDAVVPNAHEAARPASAPPRCFPFSYARKRSTLGKVNDVAIYFGTMFGNAERYARSLAHEISHQRRLRVDVHDLDAFDAKALTEPKNLTPARLYVFFVSTHFAGSPSPSAERFHKWIESLAYRSVNSNVSAMENGTSGTDPSSETIVPPSPPRSIRKFPLSIRPEHPLRGMQYAVFGVGDSIYLTYNAMAKFVDMKLKHLGATRVLTLGLGDCSNNLHASYLVWEASVLQKLPRRRSTVVLRGVNFVSTRIQSRKISAVVPYEHGQRTASIKRPQPAPGSHSVIETSSNLSLDSSACCVRDNFLREVRLRFQCRVLDPTHNNESKLFVHCATPRADATTEPRTPRVALFDDKPFAEITSVEAVGALFTQGSGSQERTNGVFRIRLLQPETTYATVSTFAIFPHNSHQMVTELAEAFGYDLDAVVELSVHSTNASDCYALRQQLPFPTPCTVRTALTEFLELRTVTREFVRVAAGFVATVDERAQLESLVGTDGSNTFQTQVQDQHKGILDLLELAPTLHLPLEVFLNITPTLKPRYYTIASSPLISRKEIEIAVALGFPNRPRGLGASFFAHVLATRQRTPHPLSIRGFISSSRFQFQDDSVSPMVFIATGVGFTAMRAIIQERLAKWYQNPPSMRTPKQLLFLGVVNEDSVVFGKDLRRWEQQMIVQSHFAYSNDRRHPRQHVQDIVETHLDEVFETVTSSYGSRIFVCGRAAMVRCVRELFKADQIRRRSRWYDTVHASGRFLEESFE